MSLPLHRLLTIPPTKRALYSLHHQSQHHPTTRHQPQSRHFTTSTPKMDRKPVFAPASDAARLETELRPLMDGPRWVLSREGDGIEGEFRFKTFGKTWDFMTAVSLKCKVYNHHPEWSNVYNTTFIRWTTHDPKGLTQKDIDMAKTCDVLAAEFNELPPSAPRGSGAESVGGEACSLGRDLAGRAANAAGPECCSGKR